MRNGPLRSSKVVDFGTNRKRVCDFLLVINSNLGPILPRFRDIAGFLLRTTPPLIHPNFRGVPLLLDHRCCHNCCGSEEQRPYRLIIRVITFELVQRICPRCINVTDRQTDRQTDGRTTYTLGRVRAEPSLQLGPCAYAAENQRVGKTRRRTIYMYSADRQSHGHATPASQSDSTQL